MEAVLAGIVLLEMLGGKFVYQWIGGPNQDVSAGNFTLFYLACSQLTLFALIGLRGLRKNRLLSHRQLTPGLVFILSFALLITIGTLLLKTPRATPNGIGWVDALFTSTSAVCVTGLITANPATDFTRHGQWVILTLIQLGGLGMMTITYFFAYFFAGGVSLRNRIALQDLLSEENLGQVGTVLGTIVGFTLTCEAIGAVLIHLSIGSNTFIEDPLFFSIFHSISAFCNAGFSTLKDNLADSTLNGNSSILLIIMGLIVAGGIGFPVMKNLWQVVFALIRKKLGLRAAIPPRLSTNSRVVLTTTLLLLIGGTVLIYLTEFVFSNGDSSGHPPILIAAFNAVTARTAGFAATTGPLFNSATAMLVMFLMFVGGSPASTAGGIKTSTLAVAFLSLRRILLGRADIEAFGRRLGDDLANRALSVILVAISFLTIATVVLCMLHPELPSADLAFEAVSAVGTVGLSRDLTHRLSDPAKLVLVAGMFIGRIGVLTFLFSFIPRRDSPGYRLPETTVVVS
jgi:Trk-type K+ transport system membrane component